MRPKPHSLQRNTEREFQVYPSEISSGFVGVICGIGAIGTAALAAPEVAAGTVAWGVISGAGTLSVGVAKIIAGFSHGSHEDHQKKIETIERSSAIFEPKKTFAEMASAQVKSQAPAIAENLGALISAKKEITEALDKIASNSGDKSKAAFELMKSVAEVDSRMEYYEKLESKEAERRAQAREIERTNSAIERAIQNPSNSSGKSDYRDVNIGNENTFHVTV